MFTTSSEALEIPQENNENDNGKGWPVVITKGGQVVRIFRCKVKSGYVFYQVAYYQDGKRKRESIREEGEARERAKAVLKSLAKGEVEAASMRLQDVQAYECARRYLQPTGVSLETACKEYAAALEMLKGAPLLDVVREYVQSREQIVAEKTVKEVVDDLLEAKRNGRATRLGGRGTKVTDRYYYQLDLRLNKFADRVKGPITEVESEDINDFILDLKNKKSGEALSGRTRNNYAESIRILLEFARKERYIKRDSKVLDELEEWAEEDFEIEIFTPEQLKGILAKADPDLVPVLTIGAFAGLRTAEIERLDWAEVDLEAGHIEIKARKAKTRSRRLVPITPNLAAWLKDRAEEHGPVWPLSLPYLYELQRDAAAAAGLKWKHNGLRHSFISYRVADTKNVNEAALEAGNSPEIIFEHYRELVTQKAAKAWFGITPTVVEEFKAEQERERKAKVVPLDAAAAA